MTWRVLKWDDRPTEQSSIPVKCPQCRTTSDLPSGKVTGGRLTAITPDGWLEFDPPCCEPPQNFLPSAVQCPKCGIKLNSLGLEAEEAVVTVTLITTPERGQP